MNKKANELGDSGVALAGQSGLCLHSHSLHVLLTATKLSPSIAYDPSFTSGPVWAMA